MLFNKKIFLVLTGMLYAGMINAASYIYSDSNVAVIVQENVPCTSKKVLQSIKIVGEPFASWQWGEASVLFEGQTIKACFSSTSDGIYIIDEQGNGGVIPSEMFRKLKET
jgi:hypothetical protein